jgi:acetylornithine/succinyldiaminopimelate/putrescine aminotransferase/predicted amino acid dehydrogenase
LLQAIGLDVAFERGQGDSLYYRRGDQQEVEVLDLVGGYGALLLGHNHPEIVRAITRFFADGAANHVQGSIRTGALRLAEALCARSRGDYVTVLANSGTEAVEAALKHAMLETRGRRFIALDGAFHGKTMGSLGVTSNTRFRQPFDRGSVDVIRVAPGNLAQLRAAMENADDLAAFLFEPIQGEAGVRPLTAHYVRVAAQWCADRGIPFIADESHTGLGRTGDFLASEAFGISADYIVLSKALGGGLAKISALLIDRKRYRSDFDLVHSSTFADDELSCRVALKVLELIDQRAIVSCRHQGDYLLDQLQALRKQYPGVIAQVRGRGLMIGIELRRSPPRSGFLLNHLADRDLLGPLVAGYLLNEHAIRVAPTLSDSRTIRLQPSLLIERARLEEFVEAMRDVCERLHTGDLIGLTRFLARPVSRPQVTVCAESTAAPIYHFRAARSVAGNRIRGLNGARVRRVAWVFHLIDSSDLAYLEPAFAELIADEKTAFCDRWSSLCEPVVMDSLTIRSSGDQTVQLHPILLPVTSQWMRDHSRGKSLAVARRHVQRAVDVASRLGCSVVTLGQFTSIVTRRGESLEKRNMQLTSGSSYTAALVHQAVSAELGQRSWDSNELTLAVVGAAGDVASTCAMMMAPTYRRCVLVGSGRPDSLQRLHRVAAGIPRASVATSLRAVEGANVVVCATSSTTAELGAECFSSDAIVCDASVPSMLRSVQCASTSAVTVVPGAIAILPGREAVDIPGFPLPPGLTYGCMAEALLLGLEADDRACWSGRSSVGRALEISRIAERHGFTVAAADSMCHPSGAIL